MNPNDKKSLIQYFRCPESMVQLDRQTPLSENSGYFSFGSGTTCYGRCAGDSRSSTPEKSSSARCEATIDGKTVYLPFDLDEIVENLRCEVYAQATRTSVKKRAVAWAYYRMRPLLSVSVRKHLQAWHLRGWDRLTFPRWPVDTTVDRLLGSDYTIRASL